MKLFSTALPYLLLLSFSSGYFSNYDLNKIKVINESPYNGVAVYLCDAYDIKKYTINDFEKNIKLIKKESKKHIWPWVFFNRFYGDDKYDRRLGANTGIKGMDIYNETGALQEFYSMWRTALRISKEISSPGIFVDPEAYNNYNIYYIPYLSKKLGKTEYEIVVRLKQIGSELIDIVSEEYPNVAFWFTFTGLGNSVRNFMPTSKYDYRSVTYIIQGMLERSKELKLRMKFVSGGMLSLGYCHQSLEGLLSLINKRNEDFRNVLSVYPNVFLGGTIALWHDIQIKRKGYFTRNKCDNIHLKDINDFKPFLEQLKKSYNYIWIYASSSTGYEPYDPKVFHLYNNVLKQVFNLHTLQ